jgi:cell division protein FtsW (lipid II flippase)
VSSYRLRELGLLLVATVLGAVMVILVAAARAGHRDYAPLAGVAVIGGVFLILSVIVRWRLRYADPFVLPIVGVLVAIGLVVLYRIDPDLAAVQARWVVVGAVVFAAVVLLMPDHHILERYRYIIGSVGLLLLIATMIFGEEIQGARLWIPVGGGQRIQLGEVAKVLIVIFLAGYLREHREVLAVPTQRHFGLRLPAARHLAPMLVFCAIALALAAVLNDFGTAILFFGIFLAMLYLASGRAGYFAVGFATFLAGSVGVWLTQERIQRRIGTWLYPFSDAQGNGFQMVQSLYALAEGGLPGAGLGRGYLLRSNGDTTIPELRTDFIFSAVANEMGFFGAVGLILVFVIFIARGITIAARANDGFSKLLAAGLTAAIGLQTLVILGGIVRLFPLTGVTLPFMSYGGSSVITNFALIAILLVISHRSRAPVRERVVDAPEGAGA